METFEELTKEESISIFGGQAVFYILTVIDGKIYRIPISPSASNLDNKMTIS